MWCVHSDAVLWLLYPSYQSSVEFLLAYSKECLVLGQSMVSFNLGCSGLLLKRDLMAFPSKLKLCRTLQLVEVVYVGLCWFSWGGSCCSCFQAHLPKKALPAECWGSGCGVNNLCSQCWHYAVHWSYFILRGVGKKWHQEGPLSLERGVHPTRCQGSLPRRTNKFLSGILGVFQICVYRLCPGCLPAWRSIVHFGLYSSQAGWTLKLQTLWPGMAGTCTSLLRECLGGLGLMKFWPRRAVAPELRSVKFRAKHISGQCLG